MKYKFIVFLQIALLLLCVPAIAAANGADISLDLSKNAVLVGDTVTASGKTIPNAWVPLKIIDAAQNIIVFDAHKADAGGNYGIEFKTPPGAYGTLRVVVGEGSNVATGTLTAGSDTPTDTEAPAWPSGSTLDASNVARTGLTLTWTAANDNVGVTGYRVYKDDVVIDTVSSTTRTYSVTGLSSDTSYTFKVEAGDAANNWSTTGPSATVSTDKASGGGGGGGGGGGTSTTSSVSKVSKFITATAGGSVSCDQLTVKIPAGALPGNATVSASKLKSTEINEVVPEGMLVKLGSDVYEITITGSKEFGDQTITIKLSYDSSKIAAEEQPVLHYYDESSGKWVALETTVVQENGKWYAVTRVNHLTKFAVFSTVVDVVEVVREVNVIKLAIGQLAASINGTSYTLDVKPYIDTKAGRTLVPIRFISEALGADVEWITTDRQVKIKDAGKVLTLTIGSPNVLVDGVQSTIDCTPEIVSERTFLPLRFVSENLGAQVSYEDQTKEIIITR
ncbi:stalk domain-containing protein [Desulfoscipio gibsoniae]|uniref:Uncharacterized protein containing chitin-binding domain type 3 n=1 Tax=Desulfoscipio gibsoniae DSM 7213 TaxID=767817 RepID=R4KDY6_9FIRM|nr:stalk domain-containing protein [Desulfoscipio gibsoniae]AGK99886.1 uncharacterized protein containing chitin-binding domain type 3 [Desulfoscipio gibsoniae DSM 7213]